jgi:hypothetical protein
MATTTNIQDRVALSLQSIEAMVGDLDQIIAEWQQLSEGERVSWSLDWDNEMAGLEHVSAYASLGALSDKQYQQFRSIVNLLASHRTELLQSGLALPAFLSHAADN